METGHWIRLSQSEALKLGRLVVLEEKSRQYMRDRYRTIHGTELKAHKALEPLRPTLAVHLPSERCFALGPEHGGWWQTCDDRQWALWFWISETQAPELRRLLENDARRLERARQRYAKKHPEGRRVQPERLLSQLSF